MVGHKLPPTLAVGSPRHNNNKRNVVGPKLSVRRCFYSVLCLACCLFLFPLLATVLLQDVLLHYHHHHVRQRQEPPWHPMEPATIQHWRPSSRLQATNNNKQPPDAHFNGFPLQLVIVDQSNDETTTTHHHSNVHCIGDNYQEDSWMERSCHFSMLCYDLREQDFLIFQSHREEVLNRFLNYRPGMGASSAMNGTVGVALGGINQKWQLATSDKPTSKSFKWYPRILNATSLTSYYALPSNTVMVPYHSLSAKNPGHLVWDDFLPIYTLLSMFQLQNRIILPLRITLQERLWSSCEMSHDNEFACQQMTEKFAPLLVGHDYPYNLTTTNTVHFTTTTTQQPRQSNYVCAPRGAAGLGALTDHGTKKLHGWMRNDYKITHNHGRGALLYEFRNFMLHNLGLPLNAVQPKAKPYRIVFSLSSSDIKSRDLDFTKQIYALRQHFPNDLVSIESYTMKDLSVQQQVQLASETSIFVTICGGGAVTGMFLPKGAVVILYYLEHGGVEYGVPTHLPAHLDWDLFNHMSHLRTHWMPTATMDNRVDLRALVLLIEHELNLIQSQVLS